MTRTLGSLLQFSLASVLMAAAASAQTTYNYSGNPFDTIISQSSGPSFTTSDSVSGSFTIAAPLAPNLTSSDISSQITGYEFGAGSVSYDETNTDISAIVSTDGNGDISQWHIMASDPYPWITGLPVVFVATVSEAGVATDQAGSCLAVDNEICEQLGPIDGGLNSDNPGTWSISNPGPGTGTPPRVTVDLLWKDTGTSTLRIRPDDAGGSGRRVLKVVATLREAVTFGFQSVGWSDAGGLEAFSANNREPYDSPLDGDLHQTKFAEALPLEVTFGLPDCGSCTDTVRNLGGQADPPHTFGPSSLPNTYPGVFTIGSVIFDTRGVTASTTLDLFLRLMIDEWLDTNSQPISEAVYNDAQLVVDDDLDGVADEIEDAAPNGGDGNGDGVPDKQQGSVTSLPDGEDSGYVTVQPATICKNRSIQNVGTLSEAETGSPDPGYDYPHGLVSFEITSPCAPTDVKLYFHGATSLAAPYRKYGPVTPGDPGTTAWYSLPTASFGSESVGGTSVPVVTLTLTDGQLGDDTGVDAVIYDIGGPTAGPTAVPSASWPLRGGLGLAVALGGALFLARRGRRPGSPERG